MTDTGGTPDAPRLRDYVAWHDAYLDPASALSARLREVQRAIGDWLDRTPGDVRILSVCAGQGHDVLGVLEARPADRARISGALVEIDPTNVAVARERIASLGVRVEVVQADAGTTEAYVGHVPADLVVLSGVLGNITPADIERLIQTSRALAAPGATVIWTRGSQQPDLGPDIQRWFDEAGYELVSRADNVEGSTMRVGVERLVTPPDTLVPGEKVFTFYR